MRHNGKTNEQKINHPRLKKLPLYHMSTHAPFVILSDGWHYFRSVIFSIVPICVCVCSFSMEKCTSETEEHSNNFKFAVHFSIIIFYYVCRCWSTRTTIFKYSHTFAAAIYCRVYVHVCLYDCEWLIALDSDVKFVFFFRKFMFR